MQEGLPATQRQTDGTAVQSQPLPSPTLFARQADSAAAKNTPLSETETVATVEDLKEALIRQLQIEHTMLATAVGKTLNWYEQNDVLFIPVHTSFEVQQLQREKMLLTQKAAALYGKELKIQIMLAEQKTTRQAPIPARGEMVLSNIKGTLVDIRKKAVAETSEEEE